MSLAEQSKRKFPHKRFRPEPLHIHAPQPPERVPDDSSTETDLPGTHVIVIDIS